MQANGERREKEDESRASRRASRKRGELLHRSGVLGRLMQEAENFGNSEKVILERVDLPVKPVNQKNVQTR